MKSQVRLLEIITASAPMTRGRLCELSRSKSGDIYYHLQYRKRTKLFQKYIPRDQAEAYGKTTEEFRRFMEAVDAYIDEMSALTMENIAKEAKDAKEKRKAETVRKDRRRSS